MTVPAPIASPVPPDPGPEEDSKVRRMKKKDPPWIGQLKVGAVAFVLSAGATTAWKIWDKLDVVNSAMAQTKERADSALDASKANATRIENVDAGTRAAIENLRKELSDAKDSTDRKLDRILAEVKKR